MSTNDIIGASDGDGLASIESIRNEATYYIYQPVEFRGTGKEFFGIWIVNLLLSIITIGIYSAWAKVRTNQYFYSHTFVAGHAFGYHAQPMQILKGRLIAVGGFVLFNLLVTLQPKAASAGVIIFVVMLPWVIVNALRFRLWMTSYRNVRFAFTGDKGEAFLYYLFLPALLLGSWVILSVLTHMVGQTTASTLIFFIFLMALLLLLPQINIRKDLWRFGNVRFGKTPLVHANFKVKSYYLALFSAIGSLFVIAVIALIASISLGMTAGDFSKNIFGSMIIGIIYLLIFLVPGSVYFSILRNHQFNNLRIPDLASTRSDVTIAGYMALMSINFLMLVFSFGFAYPWVKVRTARYLAEHTHVAMEPAIEEVTGRANDFKSALADEASDVLDVDIGLA